MEDGSGTVLTEQAVPAARRDGSPFFSDFRRRWEIDRYMGGAVFRDERRIGVLAVQGDVHRRPFSDRECALMQRLLPHVRRAVQLRSQVDQAADIAQTFEEIAEGIAVGVAVLDERGAVVFANAAARRIVSRDDGLRIVQRRLRAAVSTDDRRLGAAISAALGVTSGEAIDAGSPVPVWRSDSAQPYSLLVIPAGSAGRSAALGAGRSIVLIGDPQARLESSPEMLARLYGLTPAESRLALALVSGDPLETYAEASGIALSTARWTLKQIQAKTGCRRQSDLVRLLLTGPAALQPRQE